MNGGKATEIPQFADSNRRQTLHGSVRSIRGQKLVGPINSATELLVLRQEFAELRAFVEPRTPMKSSRYRAWKKRRLDDLAQLPIS